VKHETLVYIHIARPPLEYDLNHGFLESLSLSVLCLPILRCWWRRSLPPTTDGRLLPSVMSLNSARARPGAGPRRGLLTSLRVGFRPRNGPGPGLTALTSRRRQLALEPRRSVAWALALPTIEGPFDPASVACRCFDAARANSLRGLRPRVRRHSTGVPVTEAALSLAEYRSDTLERDSPSPETIRSSLGSSRVYTETLGTRVQFTVPSPSSWTIHGRP
jgi:hypothetical protein